MNKNGLSNVYLNNLLTPYCKYFKGVFSCNTIPNFSKNQKFSCIINLSKENEEGTHYVSIFYDTKKLNTLILLDIQIIIMIFKNI